MVPRGPRWSPEVPKMAPYGPLCYVLGHACDGPVIAAVMIWAMHELAVTRKSMAFSFKSRTSLTISASDLSFWSITIVVVRFEPGGRFQVQLRTGFYRYLEAMGCVELATSYLLIISHKKSSLVVVTC